MVTAPLMMLLYDRVFLSSSFGEIARRRWGFYLGLAATWVLLAFFVLTSRPEEQNVIAVPLSPWRYAMAQFEIIVHYLRLAVWPSPLVFDYAWRPPQTLASVVPWMAMVGALLIGTGLALWRVPWVGFWAVWFFLILAPTSSILPIADLAFEHRMYLPLAAVVVLGVVGGRELLGLALSRLGASLEVRRWLPAGLVIAVVAALGLATIRRNENYRTDFAMWSDTVAKRPDNPRAHTNLANALAEQGRTDDAVAHLSEALRLKPDYVVAHGNLGTLLYRKGRVAESLDHFSEAVRLKPDSARAQTNLAFAFFMLGRNKDAIVHYAEAARLNPKSARAHQNLGAALNRDGQVDEAIAQFSEAVRLKPDLREARHSLDMALARRGPAKNRPTQ